MAFYPYTYVATKNVKQALVPANAVNIFVYAIGRDGLGSGSQKKVYTSVSGDTPSLIPQPLVTDVNGQVQFYAEPGRIRIDTVIDGSLTVSHHDVIVDQDNISVPYPNTSVTPVPDSANKTFTLSYQPANNKVAVYVNGIRFKQVDLTTNSANEYTISGTSITFGQAPTTGDVIIADIWRQG